MRLWSIHPCFLDQKGLVALWREALLAKHVLEGKTVGYLNHPQLDRFKKASRPVDAIHQYLEEVWNESVRRKYKFDRSKFNTVKKAQVLTVTDGQVQFERKHLLAKLEERVPNGVDIVFLKNNKVPHVHPVFSTVKGKIEKWEIV